MHPKNSTAQTAAQALLTAQVAFCVTPIDDRGVQMLAVNGGVAVGEALETAKVLSSGIGQICQHMHDAMNMGELTYCDGMAALGFLAETVNALVWSVQKAIESDEGGAQ
jgi:hypothetical protein